RAGSGILPRLLAGLPSRRLALGVGRMRILAPRGRLLFDAVVVGSVVHSALRCLRGALPCAGANAGRVMGRPRRQAWGRDSALGSATSWPASARPAISAPASGASLRICNTEA